MFQRFDVLGSARMNIFKYIKTFYTPERIHQALEYQTPDQVERKYTAGQAA